MDEVKLALEMNKLVHDECKDVPHDIGLLLLEIVKKNMNDQLCQYNVVGSTSFKEWLNKYFETPKMKMMYKRKDGKGEYDLEKLLKDYKRAYRLS